MISIIALQQVSLHILLQRFGEIMVISDVDVENDEGFFAGVAMRAVLADLLILKASAHHTLNDLRLTNFFQAFINVVNETVEKF